MTPSLQRNTLIQNAEKYNGLPYVWGGESMDEGGYDCSGYIYNVLKDSNFKIVRTTADGYRSLGKKIPIGQQQPGDLLFFGTAARATHIAMYGGNDTMWESIGSSVNTKNHPGKGVILSPVSRRKDLFEVRTLCDETPIENTSPNLPETPVTSRNWLQKGDNGSEVSAMQRMLTAIGYSCGASGADGEFGNDTRNAVLSFQRAHDLTPDGRYGVLSKDRLESLYHGKELSPRQIYVVGNTYTLQTEMKVRTGAGTQYPAKTHKELTTNGKKHDEDNDGALDKGTRVTCKEIKQVGADIWMLTPSGWIAARYNGKVYIN